MVRRAKFIEEGELCYIYSFPDNHSAWLNSSRNSVFFIRTSLPGRWLSMSDDEKSYAFIDNDGSIVMLAGDIRMVVVE